MNLGALQDVKKPNDWIARGFTPLPTNILQSDGNWEAYLPVVEFQNNGGYDRYACATYSYLNPLEILYLRLTGKEINFSDRFLAKASGTTKSGNYMYKVAETARKIGLLLESQYPDVNTDWDDYYKDIPEELYTEALKFLDEWDLYHEWVEDTNEAIREALREAPLQVYVRFASGDGILNPVGRRQHFVTLYAMTDAYEIFDHYTQSRKRYSLDYKFDSILKPSLIRKNIIMLKLKENHPYLLVEGKEQKLAVAINGRLVIYDDWSQTRENSASRANKFIPAIPLTLAQWNSVPKVNGKGETII